MLCATIALHCAELRTSEAQLPPRHRGACRSTGLTRQSVKNLSAFLGCKPLGCCPRLSSLSHHHQQNARERECYKASRSLCAAFTCTGMSYNRSFKDCFRCCMGLHYMVPLDTVIFLKAVFMCLHSERWAWEKKKQLNITKTTQHS